ncbi:MAG: RNA-binding protein [Methanosarcinaceae archaeon]|nr:RNA-binding protein [Methanosarcinaceae archaeon]
MIHYITLRVSAHSTEDKSRVKDALDFFLLNSIKKSGNSNKNSVVDTITVQGHYTNPITIFSTQITRKSDCLAFVRFVRDNMHPNDLNKLRTEIFERLDSNQVFHIRFDKQAAYLNEVKLSSSSDSIVSKMKIATYPRNREKAGSILEGLFG